MRRESFLAVTLVVSFLVVLRAHFAFGAVSPPTVLKQGYGLGARLEQGGSAVVGSWNKVHFDFTFMYEGSTSDLKAFRLYEKNPNASAFHQIVEFNDLLNVTSSHSAVSGTWSVSRLNTTWIISKRNTALLTNEPVPLYEPTSAYQPGTHRYYVTAVDSSGSESAPSQIFDLDILGPIQILNPAAHATVSLQPDFRWTSLLGWPDNQVLYLITIYDGAKVVWSKTLINTTGELLYAGSPLDPASTYTIDIQGRWTSETLKPLATYFAGSEDVDFQVSSTPPPPASPPALILPPAVPPPPEPSPPKPIVTPPPPSKSAPPVKPSVQKSAPPPPVTPPEPKNEVQKVQESTSEKTPEVQNASPEPPRGFFARLWHAILSFLFGKRD